MLLQIRFLLCSRGVPTGGGVRKKQAKIVELDSPARRGREVKHKNTASESTNIHGMRCGEPKRRSVEEFRRIIILLII